MIFSLVMAFLLVTSPPAQAEFPSILDGISSFLEGLSTGTKLFFQRISPMITDLFIFVSRTVYAALIIGGLFLNYTRLNRRLGSDWIKGGILLGILSEIAPYLIKSLS